MNISQAGLQTGAVASCLLVSLHMQRPVQCCCQCNETGVRAVHKLGSIQHAKYSFFGVKHLHISQQCLVNQLHSDHSLQLGPALQLLDVCWLLERNLKLHKWLNPVSNLKCCSTMVLESSTMFLCIVSLAQRQVEIPLATAHNCQAIT
jgi:hypothetical protein